jgi:hypothetical protein
MSGDRKHAEPSADQVRGRVARRNGRWSRPGPAERDGSLAVSSALQRRARPGGAEVPDLEDAQALVRGVLQGAGRPLDDTVRVEMEERFGRDFLDVRIHTDAAAAASAEALAADAYTSGEHVVFAAGQYAPGTEAGRGTIAHELTHVVQQRLGRTSETASGSHDSVSVPTDGSWEHQAAEREAEAIARTVDVPAPQPPTVRGTIPSGVLQGQEREQASPSRLTRFLRWIGARPVPEEQLLEQLQGAVLRAQQVCEGASVVVSDEEMAGTLQRAAQGFGTVGGALGQGLSLRGRAREVARFADAVRVVAEVDVANDPRAAARAFDELFRSAGELGKRLPPPVDGYFELLASIGSFFENMQVLFGPSTRPGMGGPQMRELGL